MKRIHAYSLAVSVLLVVFIVAISYGFSVYLMSHEMQRQSKSVLKLLEHLNLDAQSSWQRLAKGQAEPCSEAHFRNMRAELFYTWHIKDVAYIENNHIVCSATHGAFAEPLSISGASYSTRGGASIWIDVPWGVLKQDHIIAIASRENYALIIDPKSLENFIDLLYRWEMTYAIGDKMYHVAGERGLESNNTNNILLFDEFTTQNCVGFGYCVSVKSDISTYLTRSWPVSLLSLLLAYLLGWMAYTKVLKQMRHRQSLQFRVGRGLATGSFYPLVQPIVDLKDNKVVGFEVLARFKDKTGPVFPDEFIPIIAGLDMSWEFTLSIMEQALLAARQQGLEKGYGIAFNFFPRDVSNGNILKLLTHPIVKDWQGKITIELTESEEFEQSDAHANLYKLRQAGFIIAIDDFGTGYSNLKYIDTLHCSYLKIDRTFVMDVEEGAIRSSIIPNIVSIAKKANLMVVAEGVENLAQARALEQMDVRYVQGYFYGRPMPIADLAKQLSLPASNQ